MDQRRSILEGFRHALRVLARRNQGLAPTPRDLIIVRRHAAPNEAGLPVEEICYRLIRREFDGFHRPPGGGHSMTQDEKQSLQALAKRALQLARLREQKHITETEYIVRLNDLRSEHGLWPLRLSVPTDEQAGARKKNTRLG